MSACDQRFDLWTKMPASYDDAKKAGPRPETTSKPEDDEDDENSTLERKIDHLNDAVRARHFLIRVPRPARTLSLCLSKSLSKDSARWRRDGRLARAGTRSISSHLDSGSQLPSLGALQYAPSRRVLVARDVGESKRSVRRQPTGRSSEGTCSGAQARGHSVAFPQLRGGGGSCRLVLALPHEI